MCDLICDVNYCAWPAKLQQSGHNVYIMNVIASSVYQFASLTPVAEQGGGYLRVVFAKSHLGLIVGVMLFIVALSFWRQVTASLYLHPVFRHMSINYKMNFCTSEKRILPMQTQMAVKHARDVDEGNSF